MSSDENDLTWVERTLTLDAIDAVAVRAIEENPGWRLIATGTGSGGQTTLTYAWPWPRQEVRSLSGRRDPELDA